MERIGELRRRYHVTVLAIVHCDLTVPAAIMSPLPLSPKAAGTALPAFRDESL